MKSIQKMRDSHFRRWKLTKALNTEKRVSTMLQRAQSAGFTMDRAAIDRNDGKLFDGTGRLVVDITEISKHQNWIRQKDKDDSKYLPLLKRMALGMIALCFLSYGLMLPLYPDIHFYDCDRRYFGAYSRSLHHRVHCGPHQDGTGSLRRILRIWVYNQWDTPYSVDIAVCKRYVVGQSGAIPMGSVSVFYTAYWIMRCLSTSTSSCTYCEWCWLFAAHLYLLKMNSFW